MGWGTERAHGGHPGEPRSGLTHEQIAERPGFNLDIWADVVDDSIEDSSLLPAPAVIAEETTERLTAALAATQEPAASPGAEGERPPS